MNRDFSSFSVEILDKEFVKNKITRPKTALISFIKEDKVIETIELGHLTNEDIYKLIDDNQKLDLSYTYIKDFSLTEYRISRNLSETKGVRLKNLLAKDSFFDAEKQTDFSIGDFGKGNIIFTNSIFAAKTDFTSAVFGIGALDFEYIYFLNGNFIFSKISKTSGDTSFKNAIFNKGTKKFDDTNFGKGNKMFLNTEFGDGDVTFANTNFNHGRVSFKVARFGKGKIDFNHAKFWIGEVIFEKTEFGDGAVNFRSADFGEGRVDFTRSEFGKGQKSFANVEFGKGSVSFAGTDFGEGKVTFKLAVFGDGKIDFHYTKFGKGDIIFERARFGEGITDFRAVEFNVGKITFNRADFGKGDTIFEASELKSGSISFRRTVFGSGTFNFEMAEFDNADLLVDDVDFGQGKVSFKKSKFKSLSLKACLINNYFDLRVDKCESLDLSDTIIKDIIDLRPHEYPVQIKALDISGIRLLGRIYIDWKENRVKDYIYNQDTTDRNRSEQFRTLKENYYAIGQYSYEDEAYVEFKRTELKADLKEKLSYRQNKIESELSGLKSNFEEKLSNRKTHKISIYANYWRKKIYNLISGKRNKISAYGSYWFQWLIFDKVGLYATDPIRVLTSMLFAYLGFSILYMILPLIPFFDTHIISSLFDPGDPRDLSLVAKGFYHSAITFLTIGYGDYYPSGIIRWLSSFEGFIGLFLMSYFTVAFVRKILR